MRIILAMYVIVLFPLILGCQNKPVEKCMITSAIPTDGSKVIIRVTNKCKGNGVISEKEYLIKGNDTFANGSHKEFYKTGKLKELKHYRENLLDGQYLKFYPDGRKQVEYAYINGKLSGPQYNYYPNGNIKSVSFYYKEDSLLWFSVNYDQSKAITHFSGSAIRVATKAGFSTKKVGEKIVLINVACQYKGIKALLNISLKKNNDILVDTAVEKYQLADNLPCYGFVYKFKTPGTYQYTANIKLKDDSTGTLIKEDHYQTFINVRP